MHACDESLSLLDSWFFSFQFFFRWRKNNGMNGFSLASKGCNLDLTLAGSQVAFTNPVRFAARPNFSSLPSDGSRVFTKQTPACSFIGRGVPHPLGFNISPLDDFESINGRRNGQLPPFRKRPSIHDEYAFNIPPDDAKSLAEDIRHRLTCNVGETFTEKGDVYDARILDARLPSGCHSAKVLSAPHSAIKSMRPTSLPPKNPDGDGNSYQRRQGSSSSSRTYSPNHPPVVPHNSSQEATQNPSEAKHRVESPKPLAGQTFCHYEMLILFEMHVHKYKCCFYAVAVYII